MRVRRLLAFTFDGLLVFVPFYIVTYIFSSICINLLIVAIISVISVISIFIFTILKDSFNINYSVGKRLMGLSIVDQNGNLLQNKRVMILRNVFSLLLASVSFITILLFNKSIGDYIYHTDVVNQKEEKIYKNQHKRITKSKILFIALCIFILWFTFVSMGFYQYSREIDRFMLPQIYESELLKKVIGNVKFADKNIYDVGRHNANGDTYISYKIITEDNKEYKIKFLLEGDFTKVIGFVLNNQIYYYN